MKIFFQKRLILTNVSRSPWSALARQCPMMYSGVTPGAGADKSSISSGDTGAWPEPESGTFNIAPG